MSGSVNGNQLRTDDLLSIFSVESMEIAILMSGGVFARYCLWINYEVRRRMKDIHMCK